jgi:hypothetical protein
MLDTLEPTNDLLAAVAAWQPDAASIAAGDEHLNLGVRCYAAAGLSDRQIAQRSLDLAGALPELDTAPDIGRHDAAIAVARHAALDGLSVPNIIALLAWLAVELAGGPDPDEIADIAQAAYAEFAA